MDKLFIQTLVQHGKNPNDSEKILVLNKVSKYINKKMKILEYKFKIKLKLEELSTNNWDCMPKTVGLQTYATIDGFGPTKGTIPIYTNVSLPTPEIIPTITPVPLTPLGPFGPIMGVPGLAVNPYGNLNKLEDRINKVSKYLDIITNINTQLEKLSNGLIDESQLDKKYFDIVDLNDSDDFDIQDLKKLSNIKISKSKYFEL